MTRSLRHVTMLALLLALAGCKDHFVGGGSAGAPRKQPASIAAIASVPLGDLAGAGENTLAAQIANPFEGNAQAVEEGHALFTKMNCAGCHGYDAKGGMGPNLTDSYWRYGGVPAAIFKSIYEGRPQGMPAWNAALPPDEIWKLTAYIESLGGAFAPADYLASVQGDRRGENVAPEVTPTITRFSKTGTPSKPQSSAPSIDARPDASGQP